MTPPATVSSTDGVRIAVHDLGGHGPTLLLSHATGFHGRCYLPIAVALADRFHSVAFDARGHGDTPQPEQPIDWNRYGDDATAMASALDSPIVAFGHSMGGTCLLMAAHRNPALFSHIIVYEPIVFPPDSRPADAPPGPLVEGARRRRSTFASYEAAIANYSAKPPMNAFAPAALQAYVNHGFAEGPDGQVHLKCRPEIEAGTFEMGGQHTTFAVLDEIQIPVLVIAGHDDELQPPSTVAEQVAGQLPNSTFLRLDELDHFGPMTRPDIVAAAIADFADL